MKRRTEPVKGFDVAIPVALRRGRVMHFRASPAYVSEFLFYGNGLLVMVSLRLVRKLFHATLAEISAEYADAIAGLCTIPCGEPVSHELWLYSRYGSLRFFRVGADGSLEEIDRDGMPFVDGKPIVASPPAAGDAGAPAPAPGCSVSAGPGDAVPGSPIIRWLAKRNAMKKSGAGQTGTTDAVEPGKIPDAGSRGPVADMRVPADTPVSPPGSTPAAAEPVEVPVAVSHPREPDPLRPLKRREAGQGVRVNGEHFSPRFPIFPAQMTLFHEKMTPLFEETPVSVSG